MKVKITITALLCALFVAVPSATLKAAKPVPASLTLSLICNEVGNPDTGSDFCSVSGSGLSGSGTFSVSVTDSCGDILLATSVNVPGFSYDLPIITDTQSCASTTVTAQLSVTVHGKVTILKTVSTII